eukprot:GHVR01020707.1.p1 GENE.GHVR01020707.1~~GHVR01020707.1.p1  ORF type:complete len:682 (+),score=175.76 GHVR01020707.1:24-2069(+)
MSKEKSSSCCKCDIGTGVYNDIKRRLPYYLSDYIDGIDIKVIGSVIFMFFTSIAPAMSFASLLQDSTNKHIGPIEVLLSTAITGIIFSLIGGQPLIILGVTGPVSIFSITIYTLTKAMNINFVPFYAWSQLWSGIMHIIVSLFNWCDLIRWVTRYSCETFGVLIAIIYLYTGIKGVVGYFPSTPDGGVMEGAYLQLILAIGVALVATVLSRARMWSIFNVFVRALISEYAPSVSMLLFVGISFIGFAPNANIPRLPVPESFGPTDPNRTSFIVDLLDIPVWGIFVAIIPGLVLTVLFFFDHNVSSLMTQSPEYNLKKGTTFHWDFLVVGVCVCITGVLGIPPTNGLIPQAPLHTKSLCRFIQTEINGKMIESVKYCAENRISNMLQSILIGLFSIPPFVAVLGYIPVSTLHGLFIFMGIASFNGNQFYERLTMCVTQPSLRHSDHLYIKIVPFIQILLFTLLQLLVTIIIFGITLTPAAMVFPILIAVLIPYRQIILPRIFPHCNDLDHNGPPVDKNFININDDDIDTIEDVDSVYEFEYEYGHIGGSIQRRLRATRPFASEGFGTHHHFNNNKIVGTNLDLNKNNKFDKNNKLQTHDEVIQLPPNLNLNKNKNLNNNNNISNIQNNINNNNINENNNNGNNNDGNIISDASRLDTHTIDNDLLDTHIMDTIHDVQGGNFV